VSGAKDDGIGLLGRLLRRKDHAPVPAAFRDALTREIILTERLRVKAVIITVSLLIGVVTILHFAAPSVFDRISHGRFDLVPQYKVYAVFLLFEFVVLHLLTRRLRMHSDVPMARRYLSALIETSLPTYLLYLHMNWMGSAEALGYTAPLAYFLFIVL
jgi:adenylate cyclase